MGKEEWPPSSADPNAADYSCCGRTKEYADHNNPANSIKLVVAVGESADAPPLDPARGTVDGAHQRAPRRAEEKGSQFKRRLEPRAVPAYPKRPDEQPVLDTLETVQPGDFPA